MASLTWILAGIVGAVVIVHWMRTGQSFWTNIGFVRRAVLRDSAAGIGIGALAMAAIFGLHWVFSLIQLTGGPADLETALTALPLLLAFALLEEVVFRGLLLNGLIYLLKSKLWAVLICAVLFGVAHVANPGAAPLSVISNALGGVMYSLAYLGTCRVWLPWGLHFAWNYFQGPIFGFLVSGLSFGGLITHTSVGNPLFTGGEYGPEGGLIGIGMRFVVMVLVIVWCGQMTETQKAKLKP